jgi:MoaA/NifB/PqqE/SkfB family radical SAM enzyme
MSVKLFPFGIKHSRIPISVLALAALRTPGVLFPIARALVVRKAYHYFDHIFEKGKLVPGQISIKITNVCNLRCKMCAQWGEQGYNFGKPTTEIKEIVPLETYKKLVDDVVHIRPFFYIWGGEPFLYPDLMPLMAYLKEKQLLFTVVTNGVRLAEEAEEIVYTGWDALMLSLDGPRDIHNEVRGHPQSFDTLMEGIHTVQEYKRRRGAARPYIIILTTISRDNAAVLDRTLEMASEVGADLVGIYYSWFTTEERGRRHQQIMLNRLGAHANSWTGYVSRFNEVDTAALQESVRRVNSRRWPFIRMFLPDLKIEQIPRYYQEPGNFFGYNKCVAPWLVAELMPNGDVATCRDYPDYVTGNITRENIIDIFNGERYRKFRRTLREIGMFPICARCCGLMGF